MVLGSDYASSTNVSLVSVNGEVLSSSFLSSASEKPGLSAPLSGDVVSTTTVNEDPAIVLVDRATAVLSWVATETGIPSGQLSVATGFYANPRDYLPLSPHKAYVTRYQTNSDPGREQFDEGGDILIINPSDRSILGRIPMRPAMVAASNKFDPYPDKLLSVDTNVAVLLGAYEPPYFSSSAAGRIVRVNPTEDTIESVIVFDGMHGCSAMALSPSGQEIAIACSGDFGVPEGSGIVLVSVSDMWSESKRFPAAHFGLGSVGATAAYASESKLVFVTNGDFGSAPQLEDALITLDTNTGAFEIALRSDNMPYSLGDVRCAAACGVCFAADAQRSGGLLHRFELAADGSLGSRSEIVVDTSIGLPPRYLGWF